MPKAKKQKSVLYLPFSYGPEFHYGIAHYASERGWHLNADMAWTSQIPYGWAGDGVITLLTDNEEGARFVRRLKIPVVDVAMIRPDLPVARVIKDNKMLGRMAAGHFLELGWRNFAFVSRTDNHVCRLRAAGFREELERHGHASHELILPRSRLKHLNRWDALSRYLLKEMRRLPKPLAVMAFNDYDAAVVINVCQSGGISIPREIGVVGTDNSQVICNCLPVPLSSIDPDSAMVGYRAAALLDRMMDGAAAPRSPILIPPRGVVVRQSSNRMVIADPRLEQAVELMTGSLEQNLSLEQVAERIGISRKTLYTLFERELGQLPAEFIRLRRLALARSLLLQTGDKLEDIAAKCGMTLSTLMRQFRREYGKPPQQWRAEMSELQIAHPNTQTMYGI